MKKYTIASCSLIIVCVIVNIWFKWFPDLGEVYYSQGINKWWIQILSQLTGIVTVSIFECLIYGAIALVIGSVIITIIKLVKSKEKVKVIKKTLTLSLTCLVALYTMFTLFWGLNYNRLPFEINQQLVVKERSVDELIYLYNYLLEQAGRARAHLSENEQGEVQNLGTWDNVFERASIGYENMTRIFPDLAGKYGVPKPILSSKLMNYTGITGIYSPFTGEANVNIAIPDMSLPFTTLHEMAHQRGYTGENECNFLGYVTAINHPDYDFQYSGYMLGVIYVGNALYEVSPQLLWDANKKMPATVKHDLDNYNRFWEAYEGKIEEIASVVNNTYLKVQGIDDGIRSYGRVVDLMLAFYEKYSYDARELVANTPES